MESLRAAVIGSGIAGIAVAHALRRIGVGVRVFERSPECRSTGYQLNVLGNGMYALDRIGLRESLLATGLGAPMRSAPVVDGPSGRVVRVFRPPGNGTIYQPRSYYRGDLHRALLAGMEGPSPECGRELVRLVDEPERDAVELGFADGESAAFDLVIGADGARSTVRTSTFPEHPQYRPRFSALLFAAEVDVDGHSEAERRFREQQERGEFVQIGAPGIAVVLSAAGSGRFGVIVSPLAAGLREEVRDAGQAKEIARELTRDVRDPRLDHAIDLARWEEGNPLVWRVGDLRPLDRYHSGRVALVGDAAHAMIPVVGQGANQSFEDAMVLAAELGEAMGSGLERRAAVERALARFSADRAPHVAVVQREARRRVSAMTTRNAASHRLGNLVLRWLPKRIFERFDEHLLAYAAADPECPIAPR